VVAAGIAQGGDPTSRTQGCDAAGAGGSSWWIAPETNARHRFFRGAVGFAMDPERRVRSQFFVMTAPKDDLHLLGFPLFATVIAGMDVVDRLQTCDVLIDVEILRKRPHPYVPKKRE
jgi:cyclophilin family peptidyl-prolyl cis-trans isomerase